MLDFRIETFLAVCETMNFTRAAEKLRLTQPAVSQHIRWLEERYQTKLFRYQGKKLSLTPGGETLRSAALTIGHDAAYLREKILHAEEKNHMPVFGATLTVADFALPRRLGEWLRQDARRTLRMVVGNTSQLLSLLDAGEVDFALVEGYFPRGAYSSRLFLREEYIAVCAPDFSLPEEPLALKDLLNCRLLLREEGSGTRSVLERHLEAHGLSTGDFPVRIETGSLHAIKELAADGCGITFLYRCAARRELEEGRLREIPLSDLQISHEFRFIFRSGSIFEEEYLQLFHFLKKSAL